MIRFQSTLVEVAGIDTVVTSPSGTRTTVPRR